MQRFYLEGPLAVGEVALPSHVARQVATVLRMSPDEPLTLFDGRGGEWEAELTAVDRRGVRARLLRHVEPGREPTLQLTLCPALLKADKLEWVLQKGTELGVSVFRPLLTDRVVGGRGHDVAPTKLDRWRRIVVEAAEQSGRTRVPEVHSPVPLGTALASPGWKVFCWEAYRERPLSHALAAGRVADRLSLFIGPEGGFTAGEAAQAEQAGAHLASLGPRILRSETAALAALALALLP